MSNKAKMIVEEKIKGMSEADKLKANKIYNNLVKGLEKQMGSGKMKAKGTSRELAGEIMRGEGCGCGKHMKGGEVSASGASVATMANHIPYAEQQLRVIDNTNMPLVGSAYYMGRGKLNYGPSVAPIEIGISSFKPN